MPATRTICRHWTALAAVAASLGVCCAPATADAEPIEGIVQPSKQVTLNAPLPAVLKELTVDEGDAVTQGQPLAFMDDALQQVAVRSAEFQAKSTTAIENAQLVYEDAQIQVERIEEARRSDAASDWEVRRTKLQAEQALAQLKAAKEQQELASIQLDLERERLERYQILAPFDGKVLRVQSEAGASLTQQDEILELVALQPLEAVFHLPSTTYGQLELGQTYTLRAEVGDQASVNARLKTIDPVIDPASLTYRVVLEIDNPDTAMPSGFPVWLDLDSTAPAAASAD